MSVIEAAWPHVEVYSIDEAFLDLSTMPLQQRYAFCHDLQRQLLKDIGIPVSIGMGQTKTLAKIANHISKKVLKIPVFNVSQHSEWLDSTTIGLPLKSGRNKRSHEA